LSAIAVRGSVAAVSAAAISVNDLRM